MVKIVIGIGGTGTTDLGLGMLSELGLKLFDEKGNLLEPVPKNYIDVKSFSWEKKQFPVEFELIFLRDFANLLFEVPAALAHL